VPDPRSAAAALRGLNPGGPRRRRAERGNWGEVQRASPTAQQVAPTQSSAQPVFLRPREEFAARNHCTAAKEAKKYGPMAGDDH
jgi:hypothetical protein